MLEILDKMIVQMLVEFFLTKFPVKNGLTENVQGALSWKVILSNTQTTYPVEQDRYLLSFFLLLCYF
jgi:hypothetical protein